MILKRESGQLALPILIALLIALALAGTASAHRPKFPYPARGERYAYARGLTKCSGDRRYLVQLAVFLSTDKASSRLLAHPQQQPRLQLRARVAEVWSARQVPKRLASWYRHGCLDAPWYHRDFSP
jgi:hypothetical protein